MNTPDALIGQQLGNILIQQPLGRGGMARVYKGIDQSLRRAVAIKVIAEDLRTSSSYAQRFEREARAVANLKHPNIVTIFQFGSQNALYYLVMEYIDGVDLDAILRNYEDNGELMPHADVIRILQAIGGALDYAHLQGVIHRDVKPSNIMLERDGRPVLTDFGLALRISEGTVGDTFGSPHYISPEQARSSSNAVPQSDIYSLGVVAYELLTGAVPFDDPSATALAMQHMLAEVPSPRAFNRNLSEAVEAALFKVLAKEPHERYQTCEAFTAALRDALEALRQNPVKAATTDLPPLPAGVEPPPPRRLSMQTARDKLNQELAFTQARGQALTRDPIAVAGLPGSNDQAQTVPRHPGWLTYALAALVALVAVAVAGLLLSSSLKAPMPAPTVAAAPSDTSVPLAAETRIPTTAVPTVMAILPTQLPSKVPATAVPTATPTTRAPTAASTLAPTTLVPTIAPTQALNDVSTAPPVILTTAVPPTTTPTQAATQSPTTGSPTVLYPNGQLFTMIWDDVAFYGANQSQDNILIGNLTLERLLTDGGYGERYEGKRWAAYYPYIQPKKCVILRATAVFYFPSQECPYGINANVNALKTELFWTVTSNSVEFRVLWSNKEIARCQIVQKRCEVRLPTR